MVLWYPYPYHARAGVTDGTWRGGTPGWAEKLSVQRHSYVIEGIGYMKQGEMSAHKEAHKVT